MLLARVTDGAELPLFRDLLKAHEYLRAKGLTFDLVVLNEHGAGYRQDLQESLQADPAERSRARLGSTSRAGCSCGAPISCRRRIRRCCGPPREW